MNMLRFIAIEAIEIGAIASRNVLDGGHTFGSIARTLQYELGISDPFLVGFVRSVVGGVAAVIGHQHPFQPIKHQQPRSSLQLAKEKLRQFESAQANGEALPLPTRTPIATPGRCGAACRNKRRNPR